MAEDDITTTTQPQPSSQPASQPSGPHPDFINYARSFPMQLLLHRKQAFADEMNNPNTIKMLDKIMPGASAEERAAAVRKVSDQKGEQNALNEFNEKRKAYGVDTFTPDTFRKGIENQVYSVPYSPPANAQGQVPATNDPSVQANYQQMQKQQVDDLVR